MNPLIEQADALIKNNSFAYTFCGGWAIDLFMDDETRQHSDVDVLVYWPERDKIILCMQSLGFEVYEMLGDGKGHHITNVYNQMKYKRNIFCCKKDRELVSLHATKEAGIYDIDFKRIGQKHLNFIEFLFNDKNDTELLYARNHEIREPLREAILYSNAVPYLSPEFCLLYKSTDTDREGYQHDYDTAISSMDRRQKQWLNNALKAIYPAGHKWISLT